MSTFYCEHCGKLIEDSPHGYVTGCEHYQLGGRVTKIDMRKLPQPERSVMDILREMEAISTAHCDNDTTATTGETSK